MSSAYAYIVTFKPAVPTPFEVIHAFSRGTVDGSEPYPPEIATLMERSPEMFERPGRYSIWQAVTGIDVAAKRD